VSEPRVVIVDNFDSFTYNLVQLVGELTGVWPRVVTHAACLADVGLERATHVILSPGPGRPDRDADFGVCTEVLREATVPVLGVCLGHQGLAVAFGGQVESAPRVVHGYRSRLHHDGTGLFREVADGIEVVRYHSLAVVEPVPSALRVTARADDGVIMALEHRSLPLFGVQFHPESVCSEAGASLLGNFLGVGGATRRPHRRRPRAVEASARALHVERVAGVADAEAIFDRLSTDATARFWLDSAHLGKPSAQAEAARFSYVGVGTSDVSADGDDGRRALEAIEAELGRGLPVGAADLPFDFTGGYVGYLGYELGAAYGFASAGPAPQPDVRLMKVERLFVVDHRDQCTYAVASGAGAQEWVRDAAMHLRDGLGDVATLPQSGPVAKLRLRRPVSRYLEDIDECLQAIRAGESYELCLTNALEGDAELDPVALYRRLRRHNPAPYAAFLAFSDLAVASSSPELFVSLDRGGEVVSKPIKGTRPRHGDPVLDGAARDELSGSSKDRAENLMIADLVRNDLGRVCELGTVQADPLMDIESFATVHQMVTTVRGRLRDDCGLAAVIAAAFPGGSMTGAPKRRSVEILAALEGAPRGVYSGSIGYFGFGGTMALNIAIRTAVLRAGTITIGAGGAIVDGSDPSAEVAEMLHKAEAVAGALARTDESAEAAGDYLQSGS